MSLKEVCYSKLPISPYCHEMIYNPRQQCILLTSDNGIIKYDLNSEKYFILKEKVAHTTVAPCRYIHYTSTVNVDRDQLFSVGYKVPCDKAFIVVLDLKTENITEITRNQHHFSCRQFRIRSMFIFTNTNK
eukprot:433931_1